MSYSNPVDRPYTNDRGFMHRPATCPSPLQEARQRIERAKAALVELEQDGTQHVSGCRTLNGTGRRAIRSREIRCVLCDATERLNSAITHEQDVLHDPVRLWPGERGAR